MVLFCLQIMNTYLFRKYNGCEENEESEEEDNVVEDIPEIPKDDVLNQEVCTLEEESSLVEFQMKTSLAESRSTRKQWTPKGIILEEEAVKSKVHLKFSCDFCVYRAKELHTLQVHGQMNHLSLVF